MDDKDDPGYIVTWKVKVANAEDPVHAAAIAKGHMMNQDRLTDTFHVHTIATEANAVIEVELESAPGFPPADPKILH